LVFQILVASAGLKQQDVICKVVLVTVCLVGKIHLASLVLLLLEANN